jgi:hypothetical protein
MSPQQWIGLVAGLLIGTAYGAIQRRYLGKGPRPHAAGRAFLGAAIRLTGLALTVALLLWVTNVDPILLVVGVMASYALMFGMTMTRAMRKTNEKS